MKITLPRPVRYVLSRLRENGFEGYAVGGCVRDSIMGISPHDWDVCTNALPSEVCSCFKSERIIETGIKHGTVTVIINGDERMPIEITTYRIDGTYTDNRRPDYVSFTSKLSQDLARRDFTVNALAYSDEDGLVDCFGGLKDIEDGIIRCVGVANERFNEDGLRILRALRFASVLGFSIEASTHKAVLENAHLLKNISAERIAAELNKLLLGSPWLVLKEYESVLKVFIPDLCVSENCIVALKRAEKHLHIRLAILLSAFDKMDTAKILRNLKYDTKTINTVSTLTAYAQVPLQDNRPFVRRMLNALSPEVFRLLLSLKSSLETDMQSLIENVWAVYDEVQESGLVYSIKDLDVSGDDLKALGLSGKEIGKALEDALSACIDERIENKKQEIIKYII